MSTEIDEHSYLYIQKRHNRGGNKVPFMHNPLHDLESIFWLSLYLLLAGQLKRIKGNPVVLTAEQQEAQHKLSGKIFGNSGFRDRVMYSSILTVSLKNIHPSLCDVVELLADLRYYLHEAFVKAEQNLVSYISFTVAQDVNDDLDQVMKDICEGLDKEDIFVDNRVELPKQSLTNSAMKNYLNKEEDGRPAKKLKNQTGTSVET